MEGKCIFEGCLKDRWCKGYCVGHYQQYHRGQTVRPLERRWRKVERTDSDKKCGKCDAFKPLEDFHRSKTSKDGRQHFCKQCQNEAIRLRRQKKREEKQRELQELGTA